MRFVCEKKVTKKVAPVKLNVDVGSEGKAIEMWKIGAAVGIAVLVLLTICMMVKCCCCKDSSLKKVEIKTPEIPRENVEKAPIDLIREQE